MNTDEAIDRARRGLAQLAHSDGRFEGELSSNAYPTLATMVLRHVRGQALDDGYLHWIETSHTPDGRFVLDPEGIASDEATRLARVVVSAHAGRHPDLARLAPGVPDLGWNLWIVKVLGAMAGMYPWAKLLPPRVAELVGRAAGIALPLLPSRLIAHVKPPEHLAPPTSLFHTSAFAKMFVAEQYTLAPLLFLIEAHTKRRDRMMRDLLTWVLSHQAADGSWFCVSFITALSALALTVARDSVPDERTSTPLRRACEWLEGARTPDGGHREAISLNVWDTSLALLALTGAGTGHHDPTIVAGCDWLAGCQREDGGWGFHGLRGPGLLSDADDTALATLALIRAGRNPVAAERGASWLRSRQAKDGSWATYRPGAGDVGCVSVTAHAVDTMRELGDAASVERALRWIERSQARDGSWEDLWLARRTYGTALAVNALASAGRTGSVLNRGIRWLLAAQQDDGGWGETQSGERRSSTAEQTAFAVQALRAADVDARRGIDWLRSRQRPDGGWDAAPIGIYWEVIGGYANPMNAWVFPLMALSAGSGSNS
ncbi:hypothetical protein FJZ36_01860 [Candidatus Poribacteria bacterium]|nr:hypothetical protein [Candidatus Poribacteria bacterium]